MTTKITFQDWQIWFAEHEKYLLEEYRQAIEKAIEGGWDRSKTPGLIIHIEGGRYAAMGFFLDPTFWQALGKSMGWKYEVVRHGKCNMPGCDGTHVKPGTGDWLYHWHRLIDHLAEGNDINLFFETL